MQSDSVLYPMVGVGAFFALFWTGFVVAWELGVPCAAVLGVALTSACCGAWAIARVAAREARPEDPPCAPARAVPARDARRTAGAAMPVSALAR